MRRCIFHYLLSAIVLSVAQAQLPQRQAEILREVGRVGGKIDKNLHAEFWQSVPQDAVEAKKIAAWLPSMAKLGHKQQMELWKSALLSRKARQVIETPEYLEATAEYIRFAYKESPYKVGSDEYEAYITNFEAATSAARKNSYQLLLAASEQRDAVATNGMLMSTNPEAIQEVIRNLDSAFQRLAKLASPIWED